MSRVRAAPRLGLLLGALAGVVICAAGCRRPRATAPGMATVDWLVGSGSDRLLARGIDHGDLPGCGCPKSDRLAIDDRGHRVVFASGSEHLRLSEVGPASGSPRAVTNPQKGVDDVGPGILDDGTLVFLRTGRKEPWLPDADLYARPPGEGPERRLTHDGGDKTALRVVPGGRFLVWQSDQLRIGNPLPILLMLADLDEGTFTPIGPPLPARPTVAVSTGGGHLAVLAQEDATCALCRKLALSVVRIFELPSRKTIAMLAGRFEAPVFSLDGRELWIGSRSDLAVLDGQVLDLDSRGGGLLAFDLASRTLRKKTDLPPDCTVTPLASGALHDGKSDRLSLVDGRGKEIRSLEEVQGWTLSADRSALVVYQKDRGKTAKLTAIRLPPGPTTAARAASARMTRLPERLVRAATTTTVELPAPLPPPKTPTCATVRPPSMIHGSPRPLASAKVAWAIADSGVAIAYHSTEDLVVAWQSDERRSFEATWRQARATSPPMGTAALFSHLHPSLIWFGGQPVATWFDGKRMQIARARAPRLMPKPLDGLYSAATLAAGEAELALAWLEGDQAFLGAVDPVALTLSAKRVAVEQASAVTLTGREGSGALVAFRKARCPDGKDCVEPVVATLGRSGAIVDLRGLGQPTERAEMPIISVEGENVTAASEGLVALGPPAALRLLPVPTEATQALDLQAVVSGRHGLAYAAVVPHHMTFIEERGAFVFVQRPNGIPSCRYQIRVPDSNVASVALRAAETGVDLLLLAYHRDADRPGISVHQTHIAWTP